MEEDLPIVDLPDKGIYTVEDVVTGRKDFEGKGFDLERKGNIYYIKHRGKIVIEVSVKERNGAIENANPKYVGFEAFYPMYEDLMQELSNLGVP